MAYGMVGKQEREVLTTITLFLGICPPPTICLMLFQSLLTVFVKACSFSSLLACGETLAGRHSLRASISLAIEPDRAAYRWPHGSQIYTLE